MNKLLLLLLIVIAAYGITTAQTVVEPGDGALSAAVTAAADGDVLVLKSGGEYIESSMAALPMKIDGKVLTIKAEDGYTQRPTLKVPAVPSGAGNSTPNVFELNNCSIVFQGIEVDGGMADTTQFLPVAQVFSYTLDLGNTVKLLKIEDCYVHDLHWPLGYVVGGGGGYQDLFISADTCIVRNNSFFKAPKTISFQYTLCQYLEIENNTFYHGTRQMVRVDENGNGNDPVVLVNHNTFYSNAQRAIQMGLTNPENNGITITNNIFAKMEKTYGDNFAGSMRDAVQIKNATNTTITNNCVYLTAGINVADEADLVDNLVDVDPKFATDPGNYPEADADFTLAEDSPLLGQATDGTAIGDPRWDSGTTAVERKDVSQVPEGYKLRQNYPNPFNPTTTISFSLDKSNYTTLTIHNTVGQVVASLVDENLSAGEYTFSFNASDLPSGIYLYRITSGDFHSERKMLLIK